MLTAGVVGAAGFAGIECVRILLGHPGFKLVYASSGHDAGHKVSELYPSLVGVTDLEFEKLDVDEIAKRCDCVFLAVPHTASLAITPQLLEAGVAVLDISADYRLKSAAEYEQWYGVKHTSPQLLDSCVYGLPEENGAALAALQDAQTKLVACAGCYPTASALSALPAAHAGMLAGSRVISDCLSGLSGAGRKLTASSSFCSAHENANAYGVATHRHTPEIAQTLSIAAGRDISVVFTPHLIPLKRGILATVYLDVDPATSLEQVHAIYDSFYAASPFVSVLPLGQMPQIASVSGTNNAQVGMALQASSGTLIVSCAIDNLVKGASGQAVQCANIITGQAQDAGLREMLPPII